MSFSLGVDIESKSFAAAGGQSRLILRGIRFRVAPGEFIALAGPSGVGKTTLLNLLAGIDRDYVGRVQFDGEGDDDAPTRIGYVFQEPRLLPWRSVRDNVALVLPNGANPAIVDRLLEEVGLAAFAASFPTRLSLGMARRVALARALAVAPQLLLLDEPFVSLDAETADRLRRLLLALWRARRCAVVLVTHDLREAAMLADRVLLIAGSPSRLVADTEVPLARDRRGDETALEAVRADLASRLRAASAERPGAMQ
jgi:NitT/TauT family transport system ATP-binding protein